MRSWLNPKWRMLAFLVLANLAWMAAAWSWTERETWMWITPIALSINFLLLTYDQVLTFTALESRALAGHDGWGVLATIERLARENSWPRPRVFLIDSPSAQIFSYGRRRRDSRLFLTEGALKLLTPAELEAALTYQMVALTRSVPLLNYWVGAILDLIYRVGLALEKAFAFVFGWAPRLAAWLIRPAMWAMQLLLISPRDYQRLDLVTAQRLDDPEDLARALWKMDAYAHTRPWRDAWIFAHMCMVSPLDGSRRLLTAQPPLKRRISSLLGRYPL